jgi:hypothetical protein
MKKIILTLTLITSLLSLGFAQHYSLEAGYQATAGRVSVPASQEYLFEEASSRFGNDLFLGLVVEINDEFALKGGLRSWMWPLDVTINSTDGLTSIEDGELRQSGFYFRLDRNWQYFFITGGFDVSVINSYQAKLSIDDDGQTVLTQRDNEISILTEEFNNQFNVVVGMGPSFPVSEKLKIRGLVELVAPLVPMYDTGEDDNLYFFPVFKLGVGVEYSLN